jgi:hypothetical protein
MIGRRKDRAKARILGVERTGKEIANFPLVKLDLEVYPKDGVPYQVSRKFVIRKRYSGLEPGQEIDVRIPDPTEPDKVELA